MDGTTKARSAQRSGDWRSLAERARLGMDPEKLLKLVSELNNVLEEQQRNFSGWKSHENDQENGIQTRKYAARAPRAIDRDLIDHNFDLLRARVWERSIWALQIQRVQEIVVTIMALVLGSVMGWLLVR